MVYLIIGLTVLLSLSAFGNVSLWEKMLFRPVRIKYQKEYWRWLTHGFIHLDYAHLIVNMLTLYFFGPLVLSKFVADFDVVPGHVLFVFFYLSAIVLSSSFSYYKNQDNSAYSSLGASGGIASVVFASILFFPLGKINLYFFIGIRAWMFGILYLLYEWGMGKKNNDNIGHDAHFFGALYGLAFPIIIKPVYFMEFVEDLSHYFN